MTIPPTAPSDRTAAPSSTERKPGTLARRRGPPSQGARKGAHMHNREFWSQWISALLCSKNEFCNTLVSEICNDPFCRDDRDLANFMRLSWDAEIRSFLDDAITTGIIKEFYDISDRNHFTPKIQPRAVVEIMRSNSAYSHLLPSSLLEALSEPASSAEKKISDGMDCRDWLEQLMRAGPPERTKAEYRSIGMARFSISARAFDRSWMGAAQTVGPKLGAAWTKSGRRKRQ